MPAGASLGLVLTHMHASCCTQTGKFIPEKSNIWRDCCDGMYDWVKEHVEEVGCLTAVLCACRCACLCLPMARERGVPDLSSPNGMMSSCLYAADSDGCAPCSLVLLVFCKDVSIPTTPHLPETHQPKHRAITIGMNSTAHNAEQLRHSPTHALPPHS